MQPNAFAFPQTTEGIRGHLQVPCQSARRKACESLGRNYWAPFFHFVRVGWSLKDDQAKDLTQAFFLYLIESDVLAKFDPAKGRFRSFLKTLLSRFVGHHLRSRSRQKRGGDRKKLAFDERDYSCPQSIKNASRAFEEEWLASVLQQSSAKLKDSLYASGKDKDFAIYERYDLAPPQTRPTYAELAKSMSLTIAQVRNRLAQVRESMRLQVRMELWRLASSEQEFKDDWSQLVGS